MQKSSLLSVVTGNQRPKPGVARARGVKEGTGSQSLGIRGPLIPLRPEARATHTNDAGSGPFS